MTKYQLQRVVHTLGEGSSKCRWVTSPPPPPPQGPPPGPRRRPPACPHHPAWGGMPTSATPPGTPFRPLNVPADRPGAPGPLPPPPGGPTPARPSWILTKSPCRGRPGLRGPGATRMSAVRSRAGNTWSTPGWICGPFHTYRASPYRVYSRRSGGKSRKAGGFSLCPAAGGDPDVVDRGRPGRRR